MGGWDVYCAVCGSTTIDKYGWDDDQAEEGARSNINSPSEDTSWLADIRIIGENPEGLYPNKVYIGKTTHYDDWGYFEAVEGGDDPYFFNDSPRSIRVYDFEGDDSLAVPIHSACLELLKTILGPDDIDRELLYETVKALCSTENYKALGFDYGAIAEYQDQYWSPIRAPEAFEALPTSIPRLAQYYGALPVIDNAEQGPGTPNDNQPLPNDDPFSRLPVELLVLILSNLDMSGVIHFRCASRAASRVVLGNSFWRSQVRDHMPWLHDLPGLDNEEVASAIHWAKVYRHLLGASEPSFQGKIRGLVNRRRIWQISQQIAEPYFVKKMKKDAGAKDGETQTLESATSSALWRLTTPDARKTESAKIGLLKRFEDLIDIEPKLLVHWTESGNLAGLGVQAGNSGSGDDANSIIGREESFSRSHDVQIPRDDWVTGFIVTSEECVHSENKDLHIRSVVGLEVLFAKQDPVKLGKENGDKRLIHVSDGKFAVGLITNWSQDEGVVSKLSLLEQPTSKAPYAATQRIADQHSHEYSAQVANYLWKGALPPPNLSISSPESGYWSWEMKQDVNPMEALVLGTSEAELAALRAIEADVQFGGFALRYADGTSRAIGPRRHATKHLLVDGAGGERVERIYLYVNHLPNGLRFVTNRGRQLVVGHAAGEEMRWPTPGQARGALAGFYGFWADRWSPKTRLESVGALYLDEDRGDGVEEGRGGEGEEVEAGTEVDVDMDGGGDGPRDAHGFPWEPSPPPAGMSAPEGRIWGEREYAERRTHRPAHSPGRGCWVAWLDLRRPVTGVRITLCHGVSEQAIPVVGMAVSHGDGGEQTIGPRDFDPPTDAPGANGHYYWCWCALGDKRDEELRSRPHYVHESWRPGPGEQQQQQQMLIRSVRVWIGGTGCLAGLQFTASGSGGDDEGGSSESPVWGYTDGGAPTGEIRVGTGDGEAAGIKFYMGDNGRNATRCDAVVVGVQALVRGEG